MTSSQNVDYVEEYGGEGMMLELQPTILPEECNITAGTSAYDNIENAKVLFQFGIINWPNFTHCLPNCGLCTQFASDQLYTTYNLIVIGFILPFISLCGLCGNILSAFVYSRASLRQSYSGSLYLSALGCSDAAVIVTALFLFFLDAIRRYSLSLSIIYGSLSPVVYPAGMIAQTCSVYFTIVAGLDCFMQVYFPSTAKALLSTKRIRKLSISSILLFALVYNVPHCFESVLLDCWHLHFQSPSVELCPAPLRFHPTYTLIYYKYMYALFLAVGPLLILIILNTLVIVGTVICKKGNSADNTALILVVLLFILCNTIALLINIFETHLSSALSWRINYIIDISNLLVVFNSSFNFVIYYNFSRPFRTAFLHYFYGKKSVPQSPPSNCPKKKKKVMPPNVIRSPLMGVDQRFYYPSIVNEEESNGPWVKMEKSEEGEQGAARSKEAARSKNSDRQNWSNYEENGIWKPRMARGEEISFMRRTPRRMSSENDDCVWKSRRFKEAQGALNGVDRANQDRKNRGSMKGEEEEQQYSVVAV